ncbi:hypothetical protein FKP32DRAFT_1592748 [Trametes sanguinea]|nr:hypothetical protein FKP32DRAFT_1592748 [Trametes sanguinea]
MYHAHVCEEKGCGCVFPDARLLELHQTECHDPLAAVRQERGEKIFACHVETCARRFLTPKARRLHLIQAHGYPKEYFFAVTNKGVGGLLKRWGEGVSLFRRPWRPREGGGTEGDEDGDDTAMEDEQEHARNGGNAPEEDMDEDEDQILLEKIHLPVTRPAPGTASVGAHEQAQGPRSGRPTSDAKGKGKATAPGDQPVEDVDALANAMDSLGLVPSSIRFGRGAKRGALQGARGRGARGQGHVRRGSGGRGNVADGMPMEVEHRGRGRGGGRGSSNRGGASPGGARGRGAHRGAMLGGGTGRGMGPGRVVGKGNVKA